MIHALLEHVTLCLGVLIGATVLFVGWCVLAMAARWDDDDERRAGLRRS